MRVVQNSGVRGSQKWIQKAINETSELNSLLIAKLRPARSIKWLSPLRDDMFAEYRDRAFLQKIGHPELTVALAAFWPSRGPQWDALGKTDAGEIILVEAKSHLDEVFSDGCKASPASRQKIENALDLVAARLKAKPLIEWTGPFYQTANRIAHLHFLTQIGVNAKLAFVCFTGDREMDGPETPDKWLGLLHAVNRMLGIPNSHSLKDRIVYVFPDVRNL